MHRYLHIASHGLSPRIKLHRHTSTPSYRLQRAAIPMMHPSERPVAALLLRRPILVLVRQRDRTSSFCLRLERIPLLPTASAREIAQYALTARLALLEHLANTSRLLLLCRGDRVNVKRASSHHLPRVRIRRREHLRQRQLVAMHLLHVPRALLLSLTVGIDDRA